MATIRRYAAFSGTIRRLVELLRPARLAAAVRVSATLALERWRQFTGASAASGFGGVAIEARRESAPTASIRSEAAVRAEHYRQLSPAAARSVIASAAIERRGSQTLVSRRSASAGALLQNHSLLGDHTADTLTDDTGDPLLAVD